VLSKSNKIHSIFYQDFKIWALDIMCKEDEKENKELEEEEKRAAAVRAEAAEAGEQETNISGKTQQKTKRKPQPYRRAVEGKRRIKLHAEWIDLKCKEMDDTIEFLEAHQEGIKKTIKEEKRLSNKSSKHANEEKAAMIQMLHIRQATQSKGTIKTLCGCYILDGGLHHSKLSQSKGWSTAVHFS
jgi:hypothetical protein